MRLKSGCVVPDGLRRVLDLMDRGKKERPSEAPHVPWQLSCIVGRN